MSTDALQEHLPPLSEFEALEEANRCLFCYDAPCTHACPTHIDIPAFIKKIASGNLRGSARTIFDANLLGATCARVCPVQELCEGACVLGPMHKPIAIGRLQRYAMDDAYARGQQPFSNAPLAGGRRVAVIGAGPGGLSCAGELVRRGHRATVFEKRKLPGGLSTYGIIGLREPVDVALAEAKLLEAIGVELRLDRELGRNVTMAELQAEFDAVVLSFGLGATPDMTIPGEEHLVDGLTYVEQSKTAREALEIGRDVVVIGGGNTAIDCATIAKRLGSGRVTILYRRSEEEMSAYPHEYEFAKREGIEFRFLTQPVRVVAEGGRVSGVECIQTRLDGADASGRRIGMPVSGSNFEVPADQVVKAIGQKKPVLAETLGLATQGGYVAVDENFETSVPGLFAIGDCIRASGSASTVMAVQDGKLLAQSLNARLVRVA